MRYRIVGRGGAIRLRDFRRPSMFTEELWERILDDVGDLMMGQIRGGSLYLIRSAVRQLRNYIQNLVSEGTAGLSLDGIGDHALREELKRIGRQRWKPPPEDAWRDEEEDETTYGPQGDWWKE